MQKNEQISALILAGGRGSRMGHVDKGLQPFRGTTMVQHVLQRLAPQVGSMAVNANQNLAAYAAFGLPVWPDETTGFAGPLAGLEAGLRHAATPLVLTAPCDSPFLPADLAARLFEALQAQGADVALAVTREAGMRLQPHPVFCLVRTGLLPVLSRYLAEGGRKMDGWYAGLKVAEVLFEDSDAFRNINTLDELHSLDTARAPRLQDVVSCLSGYDPDALPVRHAQQIIGQFVTPVRSIEKVALRSALDRVLAADIVSPISVPAYDNSAMDGYALRAADVPRRPTTLKVGTVCGPAVGGSAPANACASDGRERPAATA
jgi:molybdopterin molybdotransferase